MLKLMWIWSPGARTAGSHQIFDSLIFFGSDFRLRVFLLVSMGFALRLHFRGASGGIGHMKQFEFQTINWKHRFSHGGILRKSRAGRGMRPLSSREPLHLVFKADRARIKSGLRSYQRFFLIHSLLQKYSLKFFVKIEQVSIQGDHIHLLIRTTRRSNYQSFFRVIAGQIAQKFEKEGLLSVPATACKAEAATVTGTPGNRKRGRGSARRCRGQHQVTDTPAAPDTPASATIPKPKLWLHRPYTRVVRGYRAYKTVQNYIQLNEQEALGNIPYQKQRLRKLKPEQWEILWS
jgi:putative transposase